MADETGEWLTLSWAGEIDEELSSADVQEADNRRQEKCSRSISKKSLSKVIVPKNRSTERCHDQNADTEKRKQNMAAKTGEWVTLSWAGEIDEECSSDVQEADKGRQEKYSRSISKTSVSEVIVPKNRSTERCHDQNANTEKRKQNMADETGEWLTLSCASEIDEEFSSADPEEADNERQENCSRSVINISDSEVIVPKKRYMEQWPDQNADTKKRKQQEELETDAAVLQRRQKQIDYGKNTVGYDNYRAQVDISSRANYEPKTPDKYAKYSRRSWDAKIKNWRKRLHLYDNVQDKNSSSNDEND